MPSPSSRTRPSSARRLIAAGIVPPPPQPYWLTEPFDGPGETGGAGPGRRLSAHLARPSTKFSPGPGLAEMIGKALGYLPVMECGPTA